MRTIGLVSVGLMMITLPVADAAAASNRWCAVYNRRGGTSENCGYATLNQCRAQVLGLGGWCRPNPFPGTAFGTGRTWSAVRLPKGAAGTRRRAARQQSTLADRRRTLEITSPSR
jgi:hypothetical protein